MTVRVVSDSTYNKSFLSKKEADAMYKSVVKDVDFLSRDVLKFKIMGKSVPFPRDKAFYGDINRKGIRPAYRSEFTTDITEMPSSLSDIRDEIQRQEAEYCNHVVVNRYLNGNDHISWHHDKQKDLMEESGIYIVSFGSTRMFELQCSKKDEDNEKISIPLTHGSLFRLGWETNRVYRHRIKQERGKNLGTRISLIYRSVGTMMNEDGDILQI